MSYTTTPNLGLHKIDYNTERETWGTLQATDQDTIDAFAGKVPVKLLSGTVASTGDLDLALSTSYTRFHLVLTNLSQPASTELFARFDAGAGIVTTGYDFVRNDLSAKSSGTQTLASGINGAAILLSDTMLVQGTTTAEAGEFVIDISTKLVGSAGRISLQCSGEYRNADTTGYRTLSRAAGALLGQTDVAHAIKIGGKVSADYTSGIRCSYALFGIPGLA